MKLAFHLPINTVSFGQISTLFLRTLHEREKSGQLTDEIFLFPIGNVDLSAQNIPQDFGLWVQSKINKTFETYTRDVPVFKLWHLNGSLESYGNRQALLTFYELDNPTKIEINIARNSLLCLSSKFAIDVFRMFGIQARFLPLAFDTYNFQQLDKKYHSDDRIVFNLCGKLEKRKHHAKIIQTWIKKFGNNPKYALQCATYNVFFGSNPQECDKNNNEMIRQILNGTEKPFNVSFLPFMRENVVYNDFLNSGNIIIGMSGGEGWGLPEFQSVAMGKHAVLLNAHAYNTWATPETVSFVAPSGKIPVFDNMFFRQGDVFNQGNIFDWNEDSFIFGCEQAIAKCQKSPVNTEGLKLQQSYTRDMFTDNVLDIIKSI